jgi:aminoglycoside/choline kinase family phosphotransferase
MDLEPALTRVWGGVPADLELQKLRGDASTRSYHRLVSAGSEPRSVVVMRLPADALKSDELGSGARPEELPFLNVQRHLAQLAVPVPRVFVDDTARGVVVLEDLGDETFEARLSRTPRAEWLGLYQRAIDVMTTMHERAAAPSDACIAYGRAFDRALLRWELDHFREWGLEACEIALSTTERATLDAAFDRIVDAILALPQGFVHRDYQSRNLMWVPRDGGSELVVIDFQDALLGPAVYDLVALLCDSYVDLTAAEQRALIGYAAERRSVPQEALERAFWLVAVQRKLKDAGRFVFIDQVRGNQSFLPWYGPSLRYVGRALSQLEGFDTLATLLQSKLPGYPDAVAQPPARTGSRA